MRRPPKLDPADASVSSHIKAMPSNLMSASLLSLPEIVAKAKAKAD